MEQSDKYGFGHCDEFDEDCWSSHLHNNNNGDGNDGCDYCGEEDYDCWESCM